MPGHVQKTFDGGCFFSRIQTSATRSLRRTRCISARAVTDVRAICDVSDFSEVDQSAAGDDHHRRRAGGHGRDGGRLVLLHAQILARRLSADPAGGLLARDARWTSWGWIAATATTGWRSPGISNIPASSTCMNCHNQVLKDDPRLALVRESAADRAADSLGADSSRAGLCLFQPLRPREPRRQLRRVPRADQPDGRGLSGEAVEHDVLPGLPSRSGGEAAAAGQDHRSELEMERRPERQRRSCRRRTARSSCTTGRSNRCRTAPPVTDENHSSTPAIHRRTGRRGRAATGAAWMNWRRRRSSGSGWSASFPRARAS